MGVVYENAETQENLLFTESGKNGIIDKKKVTHRCRKGKNHGEYIVYT